VILSHYLIRKTITKQDNFHRIYEQNCLISMENCLSFIKTTFRIKPSKLGLNLSNQLNLLIMHYTFKYQVNFLRMVRRALCKIIKVALTKELGKTLSYFIKLRWKTLMATNNRSRNNCQVQIAHPWNPKHWCTLQKFRSRIKESFVIPNRNLKIESQLNANYSFDNFLEGDANRLARSAGMAANKPGGTSFNPLLIFGGVGLGKTHLV
jgi:chromosomal replication initiator protein